MVGSDALPRQSKEWVLRVQWAHAVGGLMERIRSAFMQLEASFLSRNNGEGILVRDCRASDV